MVNLFDASDSDDSEPFQPQASARKRRLSDSDVSDDVAILPDAKRKVLLSRPGYQAANKLGNIGYRKPLQEVVENAEEDDGLEVVSSKPAAKQSAALESIDVEALTRVPPSQAAALDSKLSAGFDRHRLLLQQLNAPEDSDPSSEEEEELSQPQQPGRHPQQDSPAASGSLPDDEDDEPVKSDAQQPADDRTKVVLTLQTKDGAKQPVRFPKDAQFSRLFDRHTELGLSLPANAQPSFWLDGDRILATQTPADLDIEDETAIDVQW